jgi:sporulation protein YlmC with PRC-barrel domain
MEATLSRERIVGKQVIDVNGHILGSVKDIALDLKSKEFSLKVTTRSGAEVSVQVEDIAASGDVILLNKPIMVQESSVLTAISAPTVQPPSAPQVPAPVPPAPQTQPTGLCPSCGYQNDPGSRFCIKCGTKLRP